jgi:hypothetical protein
MLINKTVCVTFNSLERPKCRWKDNIKMDLQEFGCGSMNWIRLTQDGDRWSELVNAVMDL